jgi:hypothetical protein
VKLLFNKTTADVNEWTWQANFRTTRGAMSTIRDFSAKNQAGLLA